MWEEWIGRSEVRTDILTSQLLERFCATLDLGPAGEIAPQGIHWCLCLPDASTASLGPDGHPRRDLDANSFLPPIPLPRRMWASSKVEFLAPIGLGTVIERTSTVASITEKSGGSGQLVFVEVDHETRADDVLAVKERQTIVYREATTAAPTPKPASIDPDFSDWQFHRTLTPSEPLLFRYSALTFNSHRIHYDLPYARQEEGYRGLVVHGPLTATLLLDLAAQQFGNNALTSFAFRGLSPAFAGEALHLVGKAEGTALTLAALGEDGRMVMSAEAISRSA